MRHFRPFEQAGVATEHGAVFGQGNRQEFDILAIVAVKAIETKQPQVSRQPAQVYVEHEARLAQRRGAQARDIGKVKAFEHGIHRDTFTIAQLVAETNRCAIHQDQVDLGVRHTQGFDRILDRGRSIESIGKAPLAQVGRDEVVQFLVETEIALVLHRAYGAAPLRGTRRRRSGRLHR